MGDTTQIDEKAVSDELLAAIQAKFGNDNRRFYVFMNPNGTIDHDISGWIHDLDFEEKVLPHKERHEVYCNSKRLFL